MENIRIGITEQGDGGLDLSWQNRLGDVNGAVIITKNLNDRCIQALLRQHGYGHKLILHCGCTGWGGLAMEPNVPGYIWQINQLIRLAAAGFPKENIVLRIDPILPTPQGLTAVTNVLNKIQEMQAGNKFPEQIRIRISVMDMYRHVQERFKEKGWKPPYGTYFYAPKWMMDRLTNLLSKYPYTYETCAEKYLNAPIYEKVGCISHKDLSLLGLHTDNTDVNPQNRTGCLCLCAKTELLTRKQQCPHKCLYCYWRTSLIKQSL